jgi:ABC-type uncharacterized transport system auxiliary subunit
MRRALALVCLLAACAEEPTPKDAEKVAEVQSEDEVKEHKKSIEEAAEEATKLVEADAKAEIDALQSAESNSKQ